MEITQFHKMRTAVQSNASPGSDTELGLLKQRLHDTLVSLGMFEDVEVDHTDDVDHLVIAMCRFPEQMSEAQIAQRLERIWEDKLRYGFWEAHATLVDEDHVEFEGATRTSTTGHYVTLHIVAQKARVPVQRVHA